MALIAAISLVRPRRQQSVADALGLLANIFMAWQSTQMPAVLDLDGRTGARSCHPHGIVGCKVVNC